MAFFVTKSISHIFTFPDKDVLESEEPSSLMKSDTPIISALNGQFSSSWEVQVYETILLMLVRSRLDESVPVGMVVLLDLLGDSYRMGTYMAGDQCTLVLPPFPQKDYIGYAIAAFMLSYRLLSGDKPVKDGFWERVLDGVVAPEGVHLLEQDFRAFLEEGSNRYPPAPILPQDPAYIFYSPGDLPVPQNPLIQCKRYLRTKWAMYLHIRTAMKRRGEENLNVHVASQPLAKDLLLQFPPCYEYIMKRDIQFQETRTRVPGLWEASNEEVHEYLVEEQHRVKELRESTEKLHAMMGLGMRISED